MTVCRLESLLRPPEHPGLHSIRRYRGPSPGVRVLPWVFRSLPRKVLRTINTCEKTPCRYLLSRPSLGTAWPPEYPGLRSMCRHRGPLPGVRVLPLEVRSPLTFRGEPPARTWLIFSLSGVGNQLATVVPEIAHSSYSRHFDLAAILFWMGW
jgi:hypothetical protein